MDIRKRSIPSAVENCETVFTRITQLVDQFTKAHTRHYVSPNGHKASMKAARLLTSKLTHELKLYRAVSCRDFGIAAPKKAAAPVAKKAEKKVVAKKTVAKKETVATFDVKSEK